MVALIGQGPPFTFVITVVNSTAFFLSEGFGAMISLFPGGTLKNTTHKSPGNPVKFNQSDDDFETPEVFLLLCVICIRRSASGPSEAETTVHATSYSPILPNTG